MDPDPQNLKKTFQSLVILTCGVRSGVAGDAGSCIEPPLLGCSTLPAGLDKPAAACCCCCCCLQATIICY